MITKRLVSFVVVAMMGLLFIAVVGARGSIGFSKGSVRATGEISGKFDKNNGTVVLNVTKHPNASGLELVAICQNHGGNIAPGVNPVTVNFSMGDTASISGLKKSKGTVTIKDGDLVAFLSDDTLNDLFNPADTCPNGNWDVVEAYPVGFTATIDVKSGDSVDQRFEYVCGTTLAAGGSPFVNGDLFSGTEYNCAETLDTTNP